MREMLSLVLGTVLSRRWPSFCSDKSSRGVIVMSKPSKQFFVLVSMLSWLWLWRGLMFTPVHAAVPGHAYDQREDMQQSSPTRENSPDNNVPLGTTQQPPPARFPDTDTEHNQKLCGVPEPIMAHCQPVPGSPLSAS